MYDVSAVLLHLNESTVEQARGSLESQTVAPQEIVFVSGVQPFGRAFNEAVSRVRTSWFLQCDADMELYPHCLETLLQHRQHEKVAVVVAHLQDPLQGRIRGVKLFRTRVCRQFPLSLERPDAETGQIARIQSEGWGLVTLEEVLGVHRREAGSEVYHFERFRLLGLKIRLKEAWYDLTHRLEQLRLAGRPESLSGAAALWLGLTVMDEGVHDELRASPDFLLWRQSQGNGRTRLPDLAPEDEPQRVFLQGWARGLAERPRRSVDLRGLVGLGLQVGRTENWLWTAGFLAAYFDSKSRSCEEIWARVEPWLPSAGQL